MRCLGATLRSRIPGAGTWGTRGGGPRVWAREFWGRIRCARGAGPGAAAGARSRGATGPRHSEKRWLCWTKQGRLVRRLFVQRPEQNAGVSAPDTAKSDGPVGQNKAVLFDGFLFNDRNKTPVFRPAKQRNDRPVGQDKAVLLFRRPERKRLCFGSRNRRFCSGARGSGSAAAAGPQPARPAPKTAEERRSSDARAKPRRVCTRAARTGASASPGKIRPNPDTPP